MINQYLKTGLLVFFFSIFFICQIDAQTQPPPPPPATKMPPHPPRPPGFRSQNSEIKPPSIVPPPPPAPFPGISIRDWTYDYTIGDRKNYRTEYLEFKKQESSLIERPNNYKVDYRILMKIKTNWGFDTIIYHFNEDASILTQESAIVNSFGNRTLLVEDNSNSSHIQYFFKDKKIQKAKLYKPLERRKKRSEEIILIDKTEKTKTILGIECQEIIVTAVKNYRIWVTNKFKKGLNNTSWKFNGELLQSEYLKNMTILEMDIQNRHTKAYENILQAISIGKNEIIDVSDFDKDSTF